MEIIYKKIEELIPYEKNPRINKKAVEAVVNSIKDFGFKNPIILDKNNVIICGHTRLLASKELELKEVPCIIANDLDENKVKALRIVDNKTSELSEWNLDLLESEIQELMNADYDLTNFGFDVDEFIKENFEVFEDDFDESEVTESRVKKGQKWKLGNHYLLCGDATNSDDLEKLLNGEKVDLVLTDPPYGVSYVGKTENELTIDNDDLNDEDFYIFLEKSFKNIENVMKPGASYYIWHADSKGYFFRKAILEVGLLVKQCLIWVKNTMILGRKDYQWKHEPCIYGWKEGAAHSWYSDRKQTTVLEFDKPLKNLEHPTMKPVKLFSYLIENSSKTSGNVLDVFGGSGTTLIACEQLKRNCYCLELDEKYCDVILTRWEKLTGEKGVLVNE